MTETLMHASGNLFGRMTLCGIPIPIGSMHIRTTPFDKDVNCKKCQHVLNPQEYPKVINNDSELLTDEELGLNDEILAVLNSFKDIVAKGEAYDSHMRDVVFHIHGLQTIVMSQAAARAYPQRFRLLGE